MTRFRRLRWAAFSAALALLPVLAFAQSTPAYQSGPMSAQGNLVKMLRNGEYGDASGAGVLGDTNGNGVNPFAIQDNNGQGLCLDTASTGGLYHYLCLGHDGNNNAVFNVDGTNYALSLGTGNVAGPTSSCANGIAFFNGTTGRLLKDNCWTDNGVYLLAPTGRSITAQGTGAFQVGGTGGPLLFNDTALDTLSVIAEPGAPPSTNTTNFQLYPPSPGQKAYYSATAQATGGGEERLFWGTNGLGLGYEISQVVTGNGNCENVSWLDGLGNNIAAFTVVCGGATSANPPTLALGTGTSLSEGTASNGFQSLLKLDSSLNLDVALGSSIGAVLFNTHIGTNTAGSPPAITACGTSPSVSGTDTAGHITIGGGTVTACTLTFAAAYASGPHAVLLTGQGTSSVVLSLSAVSGSAFTVAASADFHGDVVHYEVIQ